MQHVVRYTTDCVASLLPFVPSFFSFLFSHLKQGKSLLRIIEKLLWCSYNSCASISRVYPVFFFFSFLSFFFFVSILPRLDRRDEKEWKRAGTWYKGWIHEILIFSSDWYRQNATAWKGQRPFILLLCVVIFIYIYIIYIYFNVQTILYLSNF